LAEPLGKVVVVHVRESENKPVQCREGFFWRQGAGTQKLSRDEIRDFFRSEGSVRFDLAVCPKFRYPRDFDREKYTAWVKESGITRKGRVEDVLVNIEAAERAAGRLVLRNAGVLFFAKDVRHFFPQAYVTCLLARGRDKADILDRKDFCGGVVSDIEEGLRFIERNTRTAYRIEKLRREEVPEYPMRALREAITNAVMHRDYFEAGANVFVEIYDDRIEVSNPGGLPKGLTPAELGTRSIRRNPLVADLLHRIAFIEKAGTGIRRMREDAKKNRSPQPIFRANGFFTATFRPRAEQPPRKYPPSHPASTPQVAAVLRAVTQAGKAREELQKAAGIKDREHFRKGYLEPLLAAGWLEMTIPEKPRSSKQKYQTTDLGLEILQKRKEET
jgi:ATP-dependent DNA helicase RecG